MTSAVDLWRAVDPEARLISGSARDLSRPIRTVQRTRAVAPHLPEPADGTLLVVDRAVVRVPSLADLLSSLRDAQLSPVALFLAGPDGAMPEAADDPLPVLASRRGASQLAAEAAEYLVNESAALGQLSTDLRLACAEAALADPQLATPAGLIAARIGRGVAITVDGELRALHPRTAGRALAARFAALHARLLATPTNGRRDGALQAREGLWLVERRIRPGASAWIFDDLPLAAADEVAADALTVTARALLRRPSPSRSAAVPGGPSLKRLSADSPASAVDSLDATLLAVARSNGRVAPAARQLGVHRNTVLYRLRRAASERGLDPRRPADALRILAEADAATRHKPDHPASRQRLSIDGER
ncbi:MAG: helix-turn-helix domain-containing protein [Chloroflexota bacterium]